jgi:hypothetical protein
VHLMEKVGQERNSLHSLGDVHQPMGRLKTLAKPRKYLPKTHLIC